MSKHFVQRSFSLPVQQIFRSSVEPNSHNCSYEKFKKGAFGSGFLSAASVEDNGEGVTVADKTRFKPLPLNHITSRDSHLALSLSPHKLLLVLDKDQDKSQKIRDNPSPKSACLPIIRTPKNNCMLVNLNSRINSIMCHEESQLSNYESMYKMLWEQQSAFSQLVSDEGSYSGITPTIDCHKLLAKTSLDHSSKDTEENFEGRPSPEQLERVYNVLSENLPRLFVDAMDYSIYHPNVIVENNIRGGRSVGIYNWVKQVALLRTIAHIKFAYVKFEILKITRHQDDGTVKVRWRIKGLSALKVMLNFWKFKLWKYREMFDHQELWYDGFSTFYVANDGLVHKLVIDKIMPENNIDLNKKESSLSPKMAILFGFLLPPNFDY